MRCVQFNAIRLNLPRGGSIYWTPPYPLIVEAVNRLKLRSCLIGGEAVACDDNGVAVFERLRLKPSGRHVFLFAFDLLELDGEDLRREPFETRKATPASLLRGCLPGLHQRAPSVSWRRGVPPRLQDGARRDSSRRQSPGSSVTMRPMRGERTSARLARMSGSNWRRKRSPCRTMIPRSRRKPRI